MLGCHTQERSWGLRSHSVDHLPCNRRKGGKNNPTTQIRLLLLLLLHMLPKFSRFLASAGATGARLLQQLNECKKSSSKEQQLQLLRWTRGSRISLTRNCAVLVAWFRIITTIVHNFPPSQDRFGDRMYHLSVHTDVRIRLRIQQLTFSTLVYPLPFQALVHPLSILRRACHRQPAAAAAAAASQERRMIMEASKSHSKQQHQQV